MLVNPIIMGIVKILIPVFSQLIINIVKYMLKNGEDWIEKLPDAVEEIVSNIIDGTKKDVCDFANNYHRFEGTSEEKESKIAEALEKVKERLRSV